MNVSLTPELEKYIAKKVKSGMYQTASEVVREGLRAMQTGEEKLAALRREVLKGVEQYERGEYTAYDEEGLTQLFEDIKSEGRKRLMAKRGRV